MKQFVPGHISAGEYPVVPTRQSRCLLTIENDEPLFCVDYGKRGTKPEGLVEYGGEKQLRAICGRESGHMYYMFILRTELRLYNWLLNAMKGAHISKDIRPMTLTDTYARMPLLLTPLEEWYPVPNVPEESLLIDFKLKKTNDYGEDPAAGMMIISLAAAMRVGLVKIIGQQGLHRPFQFRFILWDKLTGCTLLGKGMAYIVEYAAADIILPEDCYKVHSSEPLPRQCYGIGVVQRTRRLAAPRFTPSLSNIMGLRAACAPTIEKQDEACELWRFITDECKKYSQEAAQRIAWDLGCKVDGSQFAVQHVEPLPEKREKRKPFHPSRVPACEIDISYQKFLSENETSMKTLCESFEEENVHSWSLLTNTSLHVGSSRYKNLNKSMLKDPRSHIPGFSLTLFALCDWFFEILEADEYIIVSDGVVYEGWFVAWRCPAAGPRELIYGWAKQPPSWYPLPDNCIVVSAKAWCLSRMAGGDFDGDLVMVTFWQPMIDFVKLTEPWLDSRGVDGIGKKLKKELDEKKRSIPFKQEAWSEYRGDEFVHYCCSVMETVPLRGSVASMAERAAQVLFDSKLGLGTTDYNKLLSKVLEFCFLQHAAMDWPKHYNLSLITDRCKELRLQLEFKAKAPKSTTKLGILLSPGLEELSSKPRCFEKCLDLLKEHRGDKRSGVIWFPAKKIYLGAWAGERIRELWDETCYGQPWHERSNERSPILEIAHFLFHRLKRSLDLPRPSALEGKLADEVAVIFLSSRKGEMKQLRSLWDSAFL